jgi:hypothetical protein
MTRRHNAYGPALGATARAYIANRRTPNTAKLQAIAPSTPPSIRLRFHSSAPSAPPTISPGQPSTHEKRMSSIGEMLIAMSDNYSFFPRFLSRSARMRSRRALSLMKPSASA